MWRCPECNETIERSLDVCWNCGTSRGGSRDPDFKPADDLTPADTANLPQVDSALLTSREAEAPPPAPEIKFGLRTLLGAVAICAIIFAIVAWYALPQTSEDYVRLGMAHLESEDYPAAIADLTRAIELTEDEDNQSNLPMIYAARAAAYNNQGDYGNSLGDVSRAIDLMAPPLGIPGVLPMDSFGNPIFVPQETVAGWHLLRANALIGLGKKEEAIHDLNIVLQNDPKNRGALHLLAIAEGRKESTAPTQAEKDRFPPIVRAAVQQDYDRVRQLVEAGADLEATEPISGRTALHWAAMTGNAQIASYLIEQGAPLEARDALDQTAVYEAAFAGKPAIVEVLLEQGANVSIADKYGTPILIAASNPNNDSTPTLRMLLDAGVDVNQTDMEYRATALHWAAYYGMKKQVQLLIAEGADLDALDKDNQTPRDWAEGRDRRDIIDILEFHAERESA